MLNFKKSTRLAKNILLTTTLIMVAFSASVSATNLTPVQREAMNVVTELARNHILAIRRGLDIDRTGSLHHVTTVDAFLHDDRQEKFFITENALRMFNREGLRLMNDMDIRFVGNVIRGLNVELAEAIDRDRREFVQRFRNYDGTRNSGPFQRLANMMNDRIHGENIRGDGLVLGGAILATAHTCFNAASEASYPTVGAAISAGLICAGLGDNFLRNHWRAIQDDQGVENDPDTPTRVDFNNRIPTIQHATRHLQQTGVHIAILRQMNSEALALLRRTGGAVAQEQIDAILETFNRIVRANDAAEADLGTMRAAERRNDAV